MPYVIHRWIGGTLSNYGQVKKAITRLLHLRDILKKSTSFYTKKELVMLQKQVARLEKNVGGIIDLEFPPAAVVVVDAEKEHAVIKEASGINIPIIALVDTNTNPSFVNYIIPGNDDSPRSIAFVMETLAAYVLEGKKVYDLKKLEAEQLKATKKIGKEAAKTAPKAEASPVIIEDEEAEEETPRRTTHEKVSRVEATREKPKRAHNTSDRRPAAKAPAKKIVSKKRDN
jgi:ribosomal protein S2, bacterial type